MSEALVYRCGTCPREFDDADELREHRRRGHATARPGRPAALHGKAGCRCLPLYHENGACTMCGKASPEDHPMQEHAMSGKADSETRSARNAVAAIDRASDAASAASYNANSRDAKDAWRSIGNELVALKKRAQSLADHHGKADDSCPNCGNHLPEQGKAEGNETAARELVLFIENDANLYRQQHVPIIKNLMRKRAKGDYDFEKSVKLFGYLADEGARRYTKEFDSSSSSGFGSFDKPTRMLAARSLAEAFRDEADVGGYDDLDLKRGKADGKAKGHGGQGCPRCSCRASRHNEKGCMDCTDCNVPVMRVQMAGKSKPGHGKADRDHPNDPPLEPIGDDEAKAILAAGKALAEADAAPKPTRPLRARFGKATDFNPDTYRVAENFEGRGFDAIFACRKGGKADDDALELESLIFDPEKWNAETAGKAARGFAREFKRGEPELEA